MTPDPNTTQPSHPAPASSSDGSHRSSPTAGLSASDVEDRVARGLVNAVPEVPSRTVKQIIRSNVLSRFNALMGSLFAIVAVCGAWRDGLFGGVVIANTHPKSVNIRADTHLQYGVLMQVMGVLAVHKLPVGLVAEPMDNP